TSGFAVGADWPWADRWLIGAGAGYTAGNLSLDGLSESSDYTAPRAFGYMGYLASRWTARLGASVAHNGYVTRRAFGFTAVLPEAFGGGPIFGGMNREATSRPTGLATDLWADWEAPIRLDAWEMRPSVSLRYARYVRSAWSESGAGSLSLSAREEMVPSAQAEAGLRV